MSTMMEKLMLLELPGPETQGVRLPRLSKLAGEDVVFTLQELAYSRVSAIAKNSEDADIHMLLEGVKEPNLRDAAWYQEKMGCPTPVEAVKKLLRPGEVRAICNRLDALCGYSGAALEDVTKN